MHWHKHPPWILWVCSVYPVVLHVFVMVWHDEDVAQLGKEGGGGGDGNVGAVIQFGKFCEYTVGFKSAIMRIGPEYKHETWSP